MAQRYRKHIRLPDHDYTKGAYFVTLCTRSRIQAFGRIAGTGITTSMELSDAGRIVDECWRAIPDHFPHARLDEMQIMPDHLHAILVLEHSAGNGTVAATQWVAATDAVDANHSKPNGPRRGSLASIIAAFKSESTKRLNRLNGTMGLRLWQPNYHERIIRKNGGERERIARYISENPANWR